jgi:hypothetical protein
MAKDKKNAALAAARDHLAGDNAGEVEANLAESQDAGGAQAGDKAGEGRLEFELDEPSREALENARALDAGEGDDHERAFWTQASEALFFNPMTVEAAEDVVETGLFSAWAADAPEPELNTATNEADHQAALDRFEAIVEAAALKAGQLGGGLRDTMLDIFRNRHKDWKRMSPSEQRDVVTAIDFGVKASLRVAVAEIASQGRRGIRAELAKHTNKGGGEIDATIKIVAADDATILALHHATGGTVLIIAADADEYLGDAGDPPIERDDPELTFDPGTDEPAPPADDSDLARGPGAVDEKEPGDETPAPAPAESENA